MGKSLSQPSSIPTTETESLSASERPKRSKSQEHKTKENSKTDTLTVNLNNSDKSPTVKMEMPSPRLTKKGELFQLAEKHGVNPFEFLCLVIKGDFRALGYDSPVIVKSTPGGAVEQEVCPMDLRVAAAKEAAQYLYPKKKAIELSGDDEKAPIRIAAEVDLIDVVKKARGVN